MAPSRSYADEQLVRAIASATSWRGALRDLGLLGTSAGAMRSVRKRADGLGLDYSHFRGQRRWTESALREAVGLATSWPEVVESLQLEGTEDVSRLKGHASRVGLDTSHFVEQSPVESGSAAVPTASNLARAGSLLAASWYTLDGSSVSWPLEPSRYDLIVDNGLELRRVQVKTTSTLAGRSWKVYISTSGGKRQTYGVDEIDEFSIIDGDLNFYRIPVADVGGLQAIHLSSYERYRLAQRGRVCPSGG